MQRFCPRGAIPFHQLSWWLGLSAVNPSWRYHNVYSGTTHFGDELMQAGLITSDETAGQVPAGVKPYTDFESRIYVLEAEA